jgi:hypothetical protein
VKTKHYLNLLIAFVLLISACSKKDNSGGNPPDPEAKKKYLTRVTVVTTAPEAGGGGVTTSTTDYTYDSKKRLSTAKNGTNTTTYTYYDDGNLYTLTNSNGNSANRNVYEFTYAGGKLTSYRLKVYSDNVVTTDRVYNYVYSGDKVSEIHFDVYYVLYTYDSNGNISKIFNHGDPEYSYVYGYDNKKNKFINAPLKFPTVGDIAGDRFNPNNQTTSTTEGLNQNPVLTTVYVYDADGYPISASNSSTYQYTANSTFTYTYSTLD